MDTPECDKIQKAKRDPAGVVVRHLFTLYDLCREHRQHVPPIIWKHLKVLTAAIGRLPK